MQHLREQVLAGFDADGEESLATSRLLELNAVT